MPDSKLSNRRLWIAEKVDRQGACSYEELAAALGVSSMTIRRDVEAMSREGTLIKTLGGVQRAGPADLFETDLRSRLQEHRAEKRVIALKALELLAGRQTVFLDGGTTCLEFAKAIAAQRSGLTVVTNSALACLELGKSTRNMVVGIGGQYDTPSASFVGPSAEESASRFFVDVAFLSTKAFLADEGTFESNIATIHIKQIIVRQASKVVLLIDHTKFGQRALSKAVEVAQIHAVVTDGTAPETDIEALRRAGKDVVVADADAPVATNVI